MATSKITRERVLLLLLFSVGAVSLAKFAHGQASAMGLPGIPVTLVGAAVIGLVGWVEHGGLAS